MGNQWQNVHYRLFYCFTYEGAKIPCNHGKYFVKFMVRSALMSISVSVGFPAFALEILMRYILVVQSLLMNTK